MSKLADPFRRLSVPIETPVGGLRTMTEVQPPLSLLILPSYADMSFDQCCNITPL